VICTGEEERAWYRVLELGTEFLGVADQGVDQQEALVESPIF